MWVRAVIIYHYMETVHLIMFVAYFFTFSINFANYHCTKWNYKWQVLTVLLYYIDSLKKNINKELIFRTGLCTCGFGLWEVELGAGRIGCIFDHLPLV